MRVSNQIRQLDVFPSYKGGRTCLGAQDYIFEFQPDHHLANGWGWVAQHRLVGEDIVGRPLVQSPDPSVAECVHHIDEDRTNNHPDNLVVLTQREHRRHHARKRAEAQKARIKREDVILALQGRTIKEAAAVIGCDHNTLRNRFPELIADRKRSSPHRIDDPKTAEKIKPFAESDQFSIKDCIAATRISGPTIVAACRHHGIDWVHKKRPGRPPKTTHQQ
jgi:hypothetical protein